MADISVEDYFEIAAKLNRALGDDYDFKAYLEAIKKRNPNEELNLQEPMRVLREERNKKIAETDWWASSDLLISDDQRKYRQALRDITKTADPQLNEFDELINVIWPEKP